jgi:hypothetical protein
VGGVGLEGGEEEGVDTEGVDVVEALHNAFKAAAFGGVEVDGIHFVDDGMFPPDVGGDTGAGPAGTGEDLRFCVWARDKRGIGEGETKGEEPAGGWCDHSLLIEMLREKTSERD